MGHDHARRELQGAARETEEAKIAREDEEMRRTGIIQSERQVFELACEYFGFNAWEKEGAA
jgi:hypothetical protein